MEEWLVTMRIENEKIKEFPQYDEEEVLVTKKTKDIDLLRTL